MGFLTGAARRLNRVGLEPQPWHPAAPPPPTGGYAPNRLLDHAEQWRLPTGNGPEDVAVDAEGRVITGGVDGTIWRFDTLGRAQALAHTRGRPLGIEILPDGRYLVCDSERGVLRVDEAGRVEVLADAAGGRRLLATNNSAVARDGTVYFTDSSARFPMAEHRRDLLEHNGTGRLLRLDPATGEIDLVADGLYFANGVGLAADESYVLVAETGAYRIHKVVLTGRDTGAKSIFCDNLPGIPDNMTSQTAAGIFWVALYSPRMRLLDVIAPHPVLRTVAANLPAVLVPDPPRRGWVLGLDAAGAVVHSLQGSRGSYAPITGVREADGWLYLGSLTADAIARVPAP
ncbi:MAG TPA: SMP-30/gluconolactonase/LRE family protein [Aldersonia sp.]